MQREHALLGLRARASAAARTSLTGLIKTFDGYLKRDKNYLLTGLIKIFDGYLESYKIY